MKTLGIFEVKTKLSQVCEEVAETHEPVIVTKRGKPLVRITPVGERPLSVSERRAEYEARHPDEKPDKNDFAAAPRSAELSDFQMDG